jgi:hypothetical protein
LRNRSIAAALIAFFASAPALADEPVPADPPSPPPVAAPPPVEPGAITFAPGPSYQADAPAPGPRKAREFQLDLGFGTEFPLGVGGLVAVEVPYRFLFQLGLGFMPHAYAQAIDGFLTTVGAYDQAVSQLVRGALGDSFVLRASGGWRPFADHGLELLGGYTLVTLGGATTESEIINAVLQEAGAPERVPTSMSPTVPLGLTMHNVHATVGWRWLLADDHLVIRASLSYVQCVAARVGVSIPDQMAVQAAVNQQLNSFLGPYFGTYARAPTLGLSAAYRF